MTHVCQVVRNVTHIRFPQSGNNGYRVRHMAPRTWNPNTAGWAKASRKARGWLQTDVTDRLLARGHKVDRGWISKIENGAPFSDELLEQLMAIYESAPPPYVEPDPEPEPVASSSADPDLVAAINAQSAALEAAIARQTEIMHQDQLETNAARLAQAAAFTALAESIDRAANGVVGTVGNFDQLLRGLLVALGAPASEAPTGARRRRVAGGGR